MISGPYRRNPDTGLWLPGPLPGACAYGIGGRVALVAPRRSGASQYVSGGGLPDDVVMAVNWGTGTGFTDAALWDTDKLVPFDHYHGSGGGPGVEQLIVVAASGYTSNWPTTNALLVRADGAGNSRQLGIDDGWTAPGDGDVYACRFYYHVLSDTDGLGLQMHPFHTETQNTGAEWRMVVKMGTTNGKWGMRIVNSAGAGQFDFRLKSGGGEIEPFDKDQTYRIEVKVTMVTATTGTYDARVYRRDGSNDYTLLYDSDDFLNGEDADEPMSSSGPFTINTADLNGISMGENGWDEGTEHDGWLFGALCVRTGANADWCGPYNPAEDAYT